MDEFESLIGMKVRKTSQPKRFPEPGKSPDTEPKPFKSGSKINTVKGIINHPILNIPAFTFLEDDSYVAAKYCVLA